MSEYGPTCPYCEGMQVEVCEYHAEKTELAILLKQLAEARASITEEQARRIARAIGSYVTEHRGFVFEDMVAIAKQAATGGEATQ